MESEEKCGSTSEAHVDRLVLGVCWMHTEKWIGEGWKHTKIWNHIIRIRMEKVAEQELWNGAPHPAKTRQDARKLRSKDVLEGLLMDASRHVELHGDLSDEHLFCLHRLCDKTLEHALALVDQGRVQAYVARESGRMVFHVHSERTRKSGQETYVCFPEHYCSCYAFLYDVVGRGEHICCKHQLAARIAQVTHRCNLVEVSDETIPEMILQ